MRESEDIREDEGSKECRGRRAPSAQAMDKLQDPIAAWLRQLGPSKTLSERTLGHGVSPSLNATAAIGSCIPRKSQNAPPSTFLKNGRTSELGRSILCRIDIPRRPQYGLAGLNRE